MTLSADRFDHACLAPERTDVEVAVEAGRAARHALRGYCVPARAVEAARTALRGTPTRLVAVVNFPAGSSSPATALEEAVRAAAEGAAELDVVVPSGWLRAGEFARALEYLARVVERAGIPVKAIVEAALVEDEILSRAGREVVAPSGAIYFKTGTGVYGGRLDAERIRTLRAALPATLRLKVSGGIRDAESAAEALAAGADLLGTSRTFAILGLE